ncbi:MAG: PQQ-like beta-propeller repeat protein [Patescibacteria group bacterium]|nr:PQQ-like beta-propeller repeat protein [Patescibacteria group bacterium]
MKKLFLIITILASTVILAFISQPKTRHSPPNLPALVQAQTTGTDWPQVQKDAAHTGYSSETLGTNFKVAWTHPFQPDRVHPQVQAIIYKGKAFVGTEGANGQKPTLYALNSTNGQEVWKFEAGGPILNSVAADNGKVFFGSLDGAVYAIYTDTENGHTQGQLAWKQQLSQRLGFSTAPIVADNKVMLGGQDGYFYALDPGDGHTIWRYDADAPIIQTAAYDQGKVFFGTLDMYVYGLNTSPANTNDPASILAWKSAKLDGKGFKDYWPVVTQGKVLARPIPKEPWVYTGFPNLGFPFVQIWSASDPNWTWLNTNSSAIAAGHAAQVADIINSQNKAIASYEANPGSFQKNLYVLDENTGREPFAVPQWIEQTMNGTPAAPCVDRDGKLVTPVSFIRSGWGRLELATSSGRITDLLYDGYDWYEQPFNSTSGGSPAGMGNPDENLAVSCTANLILSAHHMETNANYTGAFNLDTRRWIQIPPGYRNSQMFNNTQAGGTNPFSISNGMIYHVAVNELVARTTN